MRFLPTFEEIKDLDNEEISWEDFFIRFSPIYTSSNKSIKACLLKRIFQLIQTGNYERYTPFLKTLVNFHYYAQFADAETPSFTSFSRKSKKNYFLTNQMHILINLCDQLGMYKSFLSPFGFFSRSEQLNSAKLNEVAKRIFRLSCHLRILLLLLTRRLFSSANLSSFHEIGSDFFTGYLSIYFANLRDSLDNEKDSRFNDIVPRQMIVSCCYSILEYCNILTPHSSRIHEAFINEISRITHNLMNRKKVDQNVFEHLGRVVMILNSFPVSVIMLNSKAEMFYQNFFQTLAVYSDNSRSILCSLLLACFGDLPVFSEVYENTSDYHAYFNASLKLFSRFPLISKFTSTENIFGNFIVGHAKRMLQDTHRPVDSIMTYNQILLLVSFMRGNIFENILLAMKRTSSIIVKTRLEFLYSILLWKVSQLFCSSSEYQNTGVFNDAIRKSDSVLLLSLNKSLSELMRSCQKDRGTSSIFIKWILNQSETCVEQQHQHRQRHKSEIKLDPNLPGVLNEESQLNLLIGKSKVMSDTLDPINDWNWDLIRQIIDDSTFSMSLWCNEEFFEFNCRLCNFLFGSNFKIAQPPQEIDNKRSLSLTFFITPKEKMSILEDVFNDKTGYIKSEISKSIYADNFGNYLPTLACLSSKKTFKIISKVVTTSEFYLEKLISNCSSNSRSCIFFKAALIQIISELNVYAGGKSTAQLPLIKTDFKLLTYENLREKSAIYVLGAVVKILTEYDFIVKKSDSLSKYFSECGKILRILCSSRPIINNLESMSILEKSIIAIIKVVLSSINFIPIGLGRDLFIDAIGNSSVIVRNYCVGIMRILFKSKVKFISAWCSKYLYELSFDENSMVYTEAIELILDLCKDTSYASIFGDLIETSCQTGRESIKYHILDWIIKANGDLNLLYQCTAILGLCLENHYSLLDTFNVDSFEYNNCTKIDLNLIHWIIEVWFKHLSKFHAEHPLREYQQRVFNSYTQSDVTMTLTANYSNLRLPGELIKLTKGGKSDKRKNSIEERLENFEVRTHLEEILLVQDFMADENCYEAMKDSKTASMFKSVTNFSPNYLCVGFEDYSFLIKLASSIKGFKLITEKFSDLLEVYFRVLFLYINMTIKQDSRFSRELDRINQDLDADISINGVVRFFTQLTSISRKHKWIANWWNERTKNLVFPNLLRFLMMRAPRISERCFFWICLNQCKEGCSPISVDLSVLEKTEFCEGPEFNSLYLNYLMGDDEMEQLCCSGIPQNQLFELDSYDWAKESFKRTSEKTLTNEEERPNRLSISEELLDQRSNAISYWQKISLPNDFSILSRVDSISLEDEQLSIEMIRIHKLEFYSTCVSCLSKVCRENGKAEHQFYSNYAFYMEKWSGKELVELEEDAVKCFINLTSNIKNCLQEIRLGLSIDRICEHISLIKRRRDKIPYSDSFNLDLIEKQEERTTVGKFLNSMNDCLLTEAIFLISEFNMPFEIRVYICDLLLKSPRLIYF